jgi:hypothetical protein
MAVAAQLRKIADLYEAGEVHTNTVEALTPCPTAVLRISVTVTKQEVPWKLSNL